MRDRLHFFFLNLGHFLDHLFMLVFATVAALALTREWGVSYADLVKFATPGFLAFGLFSLPAGWLADKWSREGMMAVFFLGSGVLSIVAAFTRTPLELGLCLFVLGIFAAIYHPVGLALVTQRVRRFQTAIPLNLAVMAGGLAACITFALLWMRWPLQEKLAWAASLGAAIAVGLLVHTGLRGTFADDGKDRSGMAIAVNGVWGNLGVGSAALITGYFIDRGGWRTAFIIPGVFSLVCGIIYTALVWPDLSKREATARSKAGSGTASLAPDARALLLRVSVIVFVTTAVSSIIFQSTTFALPKVFDERLKGIAGTATLVGWFAFWVYAVASMGQLVVGHYLDRLGPRIVFAIAAGIQLVFFAAMIGLTDWPALIVALVFMLAAFGQIPINDYMIGRMAQGEWRARIYGVRYVVSFSVLAAVLPLIAFVHARWGFDVLFVILAASAAVILASVLLLPAKLPTPQMAAAGA